MKYSKPIIIYRICVTGVFVIAIFQLFIFFSLSGSISPQTHTPTQIRTISAELKAKYQNTRKSWDSTAQNTSFSVLLPTFLSECLLPIYPITRAITASSDSSGSIQQCLLIAKDIHSQLTSVSCSTQSAASAAFCTLIQHLAGIPSTPSRALTQHLRGPHSAAGAADTSGSFTACASQPIPPVTTAHTTWADPSENPTIAAILALLIARLGPYVPQVRATLPAATIAAASTHVAQRMTAWGPALALQVQPPLQTPAPSTSTTIVQQLATVLSNTVHHQLEPGTRWIALPWAALALLPALPSASPPPEVLAVASLAHALASGSSMLLAEQLPASLPQRMLAPWARLMQVGATLTHPLAAHDAPISAPSAVWFPTAPVLCSGELAWTEAQSTCPVHNPVAWLSLYNVQGQPATDCKWDRSDPVRLRVLAHEPTWRASFVAAVGHTLDGTTLALVEWFEEQWLAKLPDAAQLVGGTHTEHAHDAEEQGSPSRGEAHQQAQEQQEQAEPATPAVEVMAAAREQRVLQLCASVAGVDMHTHLRSAPSALAMPSASVYASCCAEFAEAAAGSTSAAASTWTTIRSRISAQSGPLICATGSNPTADWRRAERVPCRQLLDGVCDCGIDEPGLAACAGFGAASLNRETWASCSSGRAYVQLTWRGRTISSPPETAGAVRLAPHLICDAVQDCERGEDEAGCDGPMAE